MSFGRPVIISTRVGARDLVEDGLNGRIVAPDVASLASAMKSLIANPEIIERYSEWICKNATPLTIKQHGERIHQVYRTVLQQSHEQGENREG
jgi:glycosyltransferase involved in cell wall biosynthesis